MIIPPSKGAAKEIADLVRDLGHALSPAWTPFIGLISDQLDAFRSQRRAQLAIRLKEKLQTLGIEAPATDIAPAFLIPLLEHASLEADDDLQDLWATMLANAATGYSHMEMRTAFVSMLAEMAFFDVSLLATLARVSGAHPGTEVFVTNKLPEAVGLGPHIAGTEADVREDVLIALANLNRLGCLHPANTYGGPTFAAVHLTQLGKAFIRACTMPSKAT